MPIILGYMIGKAIGNLVVGILTILLKLLYWVAVVAFHVVKNTFIALRCLVVSLWDAGREKHADYKLNLKKR